MVCTILSLNLVLWSDWAIQRGRLQHLRHPVSIVYLIYHKFLTFLHKAGLKRGRDIEPDQATVPNRDGSCSEQRRRIGEQTSNNPPNHDGGSVGDLHDAKSPAAPRSLDPLNDKKIENDEEEDWYMDEPSPPHKNGTPDTTAAGASAQVVDNTDLLSFIPGMYRLLDLVNETGSSGLGSSYIIFGDCY
jgi:hypothetical protein